MQKNSSKINVQLIAETLINLGVEDIIISPGSRNGALTMQFANDKRFHCYSIVDERSAGYVALGMALEIQKPVVISCTSGSAAANYYPAITEAFYQNIPLIVLTADRPEGYADLFDGQTIRQENLFEKHVYYSTQLQESEHDEILTSNFLEIKKAVHEAIVHQGPVHINMPFSEPLYESIEEKLITFDAIGDPNHPTHFVPWDDMTQEYTQIEKVMILVGQHAPNAELQKLIDEVSNFDNVIILTETTSNLHTTSHISQIDAVLRNIKDDMIDAFKPDLLITLGQRVISKKIKQFLRQNKPQFHWHVDQHWQPDTYFALTQEVKQSPAEFLSIFLEDFQPKKSNYKHQWHAIEQHNQQSQDAFMQSLPWSDLLVFKEIIGHYPAAYTVHYSNSSVIRYSQLFKHTPHNPVYCNRGTSGIDGSTSTAIGFAMKSEKPVVLVTGDISFFYDSNALWNNYIPSHFRIILINNGGGNIFKIIPGPAKSNALETFFETQHHLKASHLASMYGFEYLQVTDQTQLKSVWQEFYAISKAPKILEINTQGAPNAETLHQFIQVLQN
ncbi:2-succinyl-5-enolpyruvyl-6-hydroxy-3-cyclohexene-1-carboxylic-acid synthase [Flavobacteriaceae bacterium Ap0902]|nr:2-succinyl-5-enolpyruvyl-6-hydroxy-3-cyclohexene-1-carboxylic-acid synthase [Flavobacteriaceae bacterium Ap0902]